MPRIGERERASSTVRLQKYLEPVVSENDDERTLSVAGIARALKISPATLKKHGLIEVIEQARAARARKFPKKHSKESQYLRDRVEKVSAERDEWKARYEHILEMYLRIEFHLRQNSAIDMDGILATALPKPIRSHPKTARQSTRGSAPRRNRY